MVVASVPKGYEPPIQEDIRRADRDNTINIYISDEYEDVLQMAYGNSSLQNAQSLLHVKSVRSGLPRTLVLHLVLTHSSHLATILSVRTRVV